MSRTTASLFRNALVLVFVVLAVGCISRDVPEGVKSLAKSDVDYVLDKHLHGTEDLLLALMKELYRLNPEHLAKTPNATVASRTAMLLPNRSYDELRFDEINGHRGSNAIRIALHPRYTGDRVFALMVGLVSQMRVAYNDQLEFFMFDRIQSENLSTFSTNLEVVGLTLKRKRGTDGKLLLRYESDPDPNVRTLQPPNALQILERMVGQLHVLMSIEADKKRRATGSATRTATMLLLPLPVP